MRINHLEPTDRSFSEYYTNDLSEIVERYHRLHTQLDDSVGSVRQQMLRILVHQRIRI